MLRLNNEKIFELEMAVIERNNRAIINAFDFLKDFQVVVYNNDYVVKENGVWYTYMFDGSYVFNNIRDLTKANLEYNKVDSKSTLIFVDENNNVNFVFAEEYKKIKLVSNDVIY
ncbi:MAG: hypothetical protein LBF15_03165 [Candidatus Peribacteria bacterium]|nr:hypothetical protein [Candidatus Peribacteria bacterium]